MTKEEEVEHVNLLTQACNEEIEHLREQLVNLEFFVYGVESYLRKGDVAIASLAVLNQADMIRKRYKMMSAGETNER